MLFLLAGLGLPTSALAYPWMIEHQYTSCAECHVDPSGGSAMTEYGRAQSENLVRMHYGPMPEDAGSVKDFLFGAVPLPEELLLQYDARGMLIPRPDSPQVILMQSDLRAGVVTKYVLGYASLGVVDEGALGARIVEVEPGADEGLLKPVSRDYWLGVAPAKWLLIRGGRMNLPFGIRSENHIRFVRDTTRTTINDDQQLGLAVAYKQKSWRTEVMGIAGNLQVSPDAYRERGYSGYFGWSPEGTVEIGVSSLVTAAELDVETQLPHTRQAHGVFGRWGAAENLGVLAEVDVLLDDARADADGTAGVVGSLEVDFVPKQGLHLQGGGEMCEPAFSDDSATMGRGWAAVQWFFLPHVDLRIDGLMGPLYCTPGAEARPMGLAQLHFFL